MQSCVKCGVLALLLLQCWAQDSSEKEPLRSRIVRLMSQEHETFTRFDSGYEGKSERQPYVVALDFSRSGTTNWFCAGAIIDRHWIVTMATCTNPATAVRVMYGAGNRNESGPSVYVAKLSFFAHKDFNRLYQNDIALINVPYIRYTNTVQPVALPTSEVPPEDHWMHTMGWGQHKGNTRLMHQLHVMPIQLMHNEHCMKSGYIRRYVPQMLCLQLPNAETSCRIDSGSPLVTSNPPVLLGMASFGDHYGCQSKAPLIYTRIGSYIGWILKVMAGSYE
ncbi:hypothetical protein KR093_008288 [Drosophila rubida]|uniref:Peptidase S1 domain-containing protein n=1 Tax=Drosophila rubida TaxID=30044 RepID=A0AAD4K3F1_9MUSC|nr:hypothetical protein KR093_008288 [Drosophila rubida]